MAGNDENDENAPAAAGGHDVPPPAARPQSVTSRARRIGGAAAAPRPTPAPRQGAAAATPSTGSGTEDETVDFAKPQDPPAEADGATSKPGHRRMSVSIPGWSVWTPAVAFAAVAVVFLSLFLADRVGRDDTPGRSADTRTKVLAAAKTCLAALNTYRYDQLAAFRAAGTKCTTGQLTKDFNQAATTLIGANAPAQQAVQQAKITTAGIESVTDDGRQWTVLAYGTLAITNKTQKQGRNDPFAVVARLQQVGSGWRLAKIDNVSSFSS